MAGSSSNWYKVGVGPRKGQRVYISKQQRQTGFATAFAPGEQTRASIQDTLNGGTGLVSSVRAKILKAGTSTPPGAAKKGGPLTAKATAETTGGQNAKIQADGLALRLSEVQARLRTTKGTAQDREYQGTLTGLIEQNVRDGVIKTTDYRPETKPQFQAYAQRRKVKVTFLTGKQADAIPQPKTVLGSEPAEFAVRIQHGTRTQTLKVNKNRLRETIDDFAFGAWGGKGPRSATPLMKAIVSPGV